MSSETFLRRAEAINETSSLITKLLNFQSVLQDYDTMRLDGAEFLPADHEEFLEFMADLESLCALSQGPAGDAVKSEMPNPEVLARLCGDYEEIEHLHLEERELAALNEACARALAKAQASLEKLLAGE